MPAPYKRLMHGDWVGLEDIILDLYRILNADTTLLDLLTPPGSDGEVVYNNDGVYGADSTFNFNDSTKALTAQVLKITSVAASSVDTDKFLVDDSNEIKFRTGAELLSDIGGSASGHLHDGATLQLDGINSDGGAFAFDTTGIVTFNQNTVTPGLTVTNAAVLGSDSAVFQPNTDSTTFFQVKNAAGTSSLLNIDTTNLRLGYLTISPGAPVHLLKSGTTQQDGTAIHSSDVLVVEGGDAYINIINDDGGTWGAALSFSQVDLSNPTDYENKWSLIRKTDGNLHLNFGTNINPYSNITHQWIFTDDSKLGWNRTSFAPEHTLHVGRNTNSNPFTSADVVIEGVEGTFEFIAADTGSFSSSMILTALNSGASTEKSWAVIHTGPVLNNALYISCGTTNAIGDYGGAAAKFVITTGGNIGFGEVAPETQFEMTGTAPYGTLHNSTHEDSDGGRESRLNFKGEQSGGEETTLARIEVGHDGVADDEKGYWDLYTNDGSDGDSPTKQMRIQSTGNWVINKTSGVGLKVDLAAPTFGWRDLEGFEIPDPTGGDRPTLSTYSGGLIKENAFSNGDVLRIRYHIPHDYVKGTDIFSHIHWSHNGTAISGNVVFGVTSDYAKGHNQANFGTEKSISITYATTDISTTPRYRHRIEESAITNDGGSATLIDRGLLEPDGIILVTFEVTTNPTITGGSPNNIFVHRADLHYQSTNLASKQKAPDFYT